MARFLFCSFALVLLYPSGIDMYLVGLPRIAVDLSATEAQLHIAFSVYLAGMAAAMLLAGRIADKAGRQPVGRAIRVRGNRSAFCHGLSILKYCSPMYRGSIFAKITCRCWMKYPIPFDDAQLQKVMVPFTLMWHKRNGHNPKIIWLKSMIKQLYGDAFQSGFLSG